MPQVVISPNHGHTVTHYDFASTEDRARFLEQPSLQGQYYMYPEDDSWLWRKIGRTHTADTEETDPW